MIKLNLISAISENPKTAAVAIPAILATNLVVDFMALCVILFWMFIIDLITGIMASYCVWKKLPEKNDKWFFGKGEGFCSKKAKSLGIKALVYIGLPYLILKFQTLLAIKNVKYETFSDSEFELASLAVIFFTLIEGFSIFHENLPKCGFNLWERIKKMIGFYKEVKNEINE